MANSGAGDDAVAAFGFLGISSWAVAIMGGLILATALTLLFLPALYAAWFRVKKPVALAKDGTAV
ncbi:hypothetical protein [Janthinobacterium sp.]|uniref:hypothetical protein n=1 Tax=Janthinobacterium sp. TaxID=1871054 RepID=UPI00262A8AA2|nr:hypothetical protein [Janthinobacterium sp.]